FATDQRHGLALHVGTHQGTVGVVVLQERNQAGGDGNELLRRNVDVIDLIAMLQDEVTGLAAIDEFGGNAQPVVQGDVSLGDDILVLFPSREIEAVGFINDLAALQLVVEFFDAVAFHDIAGLEFAVAGIDDLHEVDDASALDAAIGRFDEAVIVDARKATERADKADVRALRSFDGADAAVVRRVDVANLESGAFTGQPAGTQSGEPPLVGDLAERVGLVHELAQLRTAEEFADGRHDRLGVDQIVRHGRGHFLVDAHLLLDGGDEIGDVQSAIIQRRIETHFDVELQAADAAEIVLARVEKHAAEEVGGRFQRRRIAGAQLAIDFDERFLGRADGVLVQGARQHQADFIAFREEYVHFGDARFGKGLPKIGGQRLVGFEQHLARLAIDDVGDAVSAFEIGKGRANLGNARLDQFLEESFGDALVGAHDDFFGFRIADFVGELAIHDAGRNVPEEFLFAQRDALHLVKGAEYFFVRLHAQGAEEDRAQELALAVDAHVENVLGVVLEFDPGAAIGNDLA